MADASSSSSRPAEIGEASSSSAPREVELQALTSSDERARTFDNLELSRFKLVYGSSQHTMRRRSHTRPDADKVKKDWDTMKESLNPGTYVRAFGDRIDLIRVMIVGPAGTPYHDGLVFYDFQLRANFPYSPPRAIDLYSITNPAPRLDWEEILNRINGEGGSTSEITSAEDQSSMMMIEYLRKCILQGRTGPGSRIQNARAFARTCTQMLAILNRPPQHFEDIVYNHFRLRGQFILDAFKAYATGVVEVGKYRRGDHIPSNIAAEDDPESIEVRRYFERPELQRLLISLIAAFADNEEDGPKKRFTSFGQPIAEDYGHQGLLNQGAQNQAIVLNAPDPYLALRNPNAAASSSGAAGASTSGESRPGLGSTETSRLVVGLNTPGRYDEDSPRRKRPPLDRLKRWFLMECGSPEGRMKRLKRLKKWCLALIKCGSLEVEED